MNIHLKFWILTCLFPTLAVAGPTVNWVNHVVFNENPLEAKLGTFSDSDSPDLLAVILWNDGNSNRLNAVRMPPPYDGSGITSQALETTGGLFALGDICTVGNQVIVPYVKDFNVVTARYNGSSWNTATIPGTVTNDFDNADCGETTDGAFVTTHDLTDNETEIYRTTNGGSSYTFYGRYVSAGPFGGGVREPLATTYAGRYAAGINQFPNGTVRYTGFDTADNTPIFEHTNLENLSQPMGFTYVKESAGASLGDGFVFTFNGDGMANLYDIPLSNPNNYIETPLGPINNNGSQFGFQGSTILGIDDNNGEPMQSHVLWGDYFIVDSGSPGAPPQIDPSYPLAGVGGPIDGCVVHELKGPDLVRVEGFFVGPRVGPDGTSLYQREIAADPVFSDGFESGDTSAWRFNCP